MIAFATLVLYFYLNQLIELSLISSVVLGLNATLLLLFWFSNAFVRKIVVHLVLWAGFISFIGLAFISDGLSSPFLFWLLSIPLLAYSLLDNYYALFWSGLIILGIMLLNWSGNELLIGLTRFSLVNNYLFIGFSVSAQIFYWMIVLFLREKRDGQAGKNQLNDMEKYRDEIGSLRGQVATLHERNTRLVRLYQNLKEYEDMNCQKAELLAEAARVMDVKNKQIKNAQNHYIEQSRKLETVHEDLKNSIRYAKKIQEAIIPDTEWVITHFDDAFIYFQPKDIVSGDFYWFAQKYMLGKKLKILIAADCTGHGVPGAFMTIIGNSLINEIINEMQIYQPDQILSELDYKIIQTLSNRKGQTEIHDGMDMVVLVIDEETMTVQYAAAHNPLMYVRKQQLHEIRGSRFAVGSSQYRTRKEFKMHTIQAQRGDVFYIFTDGFQDQFGQKEQRKYMIRRFRQLLFSINRLPMYLQLQQVRSEFENWKKDLPQTDDVLLIGFRM
ncbi:MAG: SpoIIE family protein phosphatase [Bacteroidia bacterium]|nr:SpoIIE family protein phosphatase [Bacteroidia bacterium]